MTEDFSQLKNIPEIDAPSALHSKIMLTAVILKFKNAIIALTILLIGGAAISGFYMWGGIAEIQGLTIIKIYLSGFTFDLSFFSDFAKMFFQIFPVALMLIFAIYLILTIIALRLLSAYKKVLFGTQTAQNFINS